MFRGVRRFKQALSQEECVEILHNEVRGVLSVLGDDDYPYGMPMDYWYNPDDGKIYFHSVREDIERMQSKSTTRFRFVSMTAVTEKRATGRLT